MPRLEYLFRETTSGLRRNGLVAFAAISTTFIALFLLSFTLHATLGLAEYSADRLAHQEPAATLGDYVRSSQFWFESFQNWQSEFLSLAGMVVLSIFLRQRGSPESKPVAAPLWDTPG